MQRQLLLLVGVQYIDKLLMCSCGAVAGPLHAALLAMPGSTVNACSASAPVLAVLLIFSTRRRTRILRSFPVLLSGAWSVSLAEWRSVHRRCFSAFLSWWSHLKTNITFTSLLYLAARYSLLRCCLRSWVDFLGALDDSQL